MVGSGDGRVRNKPHPAAGKSGIGPPVAPVGWKWRAGMRLRDMYFTSPSGERFRSRPELANYLKNLPDAPSGDNFCWVLTEDVLKQASQSAVQETRKDTQTPTKSPKASSSKKRKAAAAAKNSPPVEPAPSPPRRQPTPTLEEPKSKKKSKKRKR